MTQLAGRVALVTGGTRGIGRGIVEAMAQAGACVIVTGRSEDAAEAVADEVRQAGGKAQGLGADLNDDHAVEELIPRALAVFGGLDILVNNAGIDADAPALNYPLEDWRRVIRMDLEVPFRLCQAAGAHFIEKERGAIINVASVLGLRGLADACSYVAAKHGIIGVSKVLAIEWAAKNVRVNVIAPGLIQTDMTKYVWNSEYLPQAVAGIPAKRIGQPKDIGGVAAFLASDAADFIHGEVIAVDGGYLA